MIRTLLSSCALVGAAFLATSGLADVRPDVTIAVTKNPSRLDPMAENTNVNSRIMKNVLETLIYTDQQNDGALEPGLAESWKRVDDSTLEFQLRQGVLCQNGEVFDAEDVAFSFGPERFQGEEAPGFAVARQYLGGLKTVKVIDSHKVQISFTAPDPLLELRFANWMSEIVCKDA